MVSLEFGGQGEQFHPHQNCSQENKCALVENRPEIGISGNSSVFAAAGQSGPGGRATKVHLREEFYLRLRNRDITAIRGCNVPELIGYDDGLWVIEMTIVSRPFVLDFAGAYLDRAPVFSEEVLADWRAEKAEQFEDRWPEVQSILASFRSLGVIIQDVNPGNISFGD
jgi:hypothetical protein